MTTKSQGRRVNGQFAPKTPGTPGTAGTSQVTPQIRPEHHQAASGTSQVAPQITAGERILNEAYTAVNDYLAVTPSQAVAITLYAAATHAIDTFPAFGRMLFAGTGPECGKTVALMTCAYLSSAPENGAGTSYALTSLLAQAHNQPEQPRPTLYRDEISEVFGKSGLNSSKDPIAAVLRDGYKRGATTMWSVNRVSEKIGIYLPVLMAGNGTAVPTDIRSRSIVVKMERGRPKLDLDSDGSEFRLRAIGRATGAEVRKTAQDMKGFTCEGMVPKLSGRLHQIWRPLIATAKFVGGDAWLKRALSAFADLTQSGGATEVLSADQMILRDLAAIVDHLDLTDRDFIGGIALSEELASFERFQSQTVLSVANEISRAMPTDSVKKRPNANARFYGSCGNEPYRGYWARDIRAAWLAVAPAKPEEIAAQEEINPFA